MDQSSKKDFNNAITRTGFSQNDFSFKETNTTQYNPNELSPIIGTILITNNKTGKSKEYQTGMATSWLIAFENDLKNGIFS